MYRKIEDFTREWAHESEATLKILRSLTEESADTRIDPDGRSLRHLAWHLAESLGMLKHAGLTLDAADEGGPAVHDLATIVELYERGSASLLERLPDQWNDNSLTEEVSMYGQNWVKGGVLTMLITHQAHHRGQMTVLMRQAGLRVPGICGPSREEWAAMAMSGPVLE